MSNYEQNKPNYNEAKFNQEYYTNQASYDRQSQPNFSAAPSYNEKRENIYREEEVSGKDFIIGVIIGGVIGAATALLLAPKTGTEFRGNLSSQASQIKDKTMDLSSTAREKTTRISKQLQEQSEQLVDKVKSIKSKPLSPLDDGTASSEGEEPMEFMETISHTTEDEENVTVVTEAFKEAITEENNPNK